MKEFKEFLDELKLTAPTQAALKAAWGELSAHFQNPASQDLFICNIQALMGLRNMRVEELSVRAGRHRSYIGRLIRKDFPNFDPKVETIRGIAQALKVKPSTLVLVGLTQKFQETLDSLEQEK